MASGNIARKRVIATSRDFQADGPAWSALRLVEQRLRRGIVGPTGRLAPGETPGERPFENDYLTWLMTVFPEHFSKTLGDHHHEFWRWIWGIKSGERPPPYIFIVARGGGKSTTAEAAAVMVGALARRRYCWYICGTQDQADDHVQTIADMLESPNLARWYPDMSRRLLGKFGNPRGWRHNRLRTASGFTIDAVGLDKRVRGVKIEYQRPDIMIFDDVDAGDDTLAVVSRKLNKITSTIMPSGTADLAVIGVQNLIHGHSIFAQLAMPAQTGGVDLLADRIISGPHPALRNFTYEQQSGRFVIVGGEPSWEGQGLEACQSFIDTWGLSAFRREAQHEVDAPPGGMFDHLDWQYIERDALPALRRIVVWVDPAVTETDESDSHGIQVDGISEGPTATAKIYRLYSWEARTSPEDSMRRAIHQALLWGADSVGVETDQGGDLWKTAYLRAWERYCQDYNIPKETAPPAFRHAKAGGGHGSKIHRASIMLADYEAGRIVHVVGTNGILERALRRFPKTKPFDLVDSAYWGWADLRARLDHGNVGILSILGSSKWTGPSVQPGAPSWRAGLR